MSLHLVNVAALPSAIENFRGDLIRTLVKLGYRVTAMAAPTTRDQVERIHALGADYRPYAVDRTGMNPLHDLQTLFALRSAFTALRPDVVLAAYIKPVIWSGLALAAFPQRPRFYALIEGLGLTFRPKGFIRHSVMLLVTWLYRLALHRVTTVMFLNEGSRNVFVARRIVPAHKCEVIPGLGVNLDQFAATPLPAGPPQFLLIARLIAAKGLREYAAAARIVRQRYGDAVFHLLGFEDRSRYAVPMAEVRAWHDKGMVEYLGETADVRPHLANCHVFVLPTSYPEGMPATLLEAMATGRPIVTSDAPGCRETVVPGENGFLVPVGDPEALAERLIWLIEHRNEWERMGRASRRIAEDRFDVHKINARVMDIMRLSRGGGSPDPDDRMTVPAQSGLA